MPPVRAEVPSRLARLLAVPDFLALLLAGAPVPGAGQEHHSCVQELRNAKRLARERLDALLCGSFGIPLLDEASGFVHCWKPPFVRLRYNVDPSWRDDVRSLAVRRGVAASVLVRLWSHQRPRRGLHFPRGPLHGHVAPA